MISFPKTTARSTLIMLVPVLFVLLGYVVYPGLRTLGASLYRDDLLTLANYQEFFNIHQPNNLEALWNSIYISLGSVFLSALIGVPLAFIFTYYEFPGRSLFAPLATLPIVLPPLVGVIAFMFLYGESGLLPRGLQTLLNLSEVPFAIGGVPAIFVVHAYTMYVFFYLFVSAALGGLDASLMEVAQNLGASHWMILRKVVLPLLTPALVAASLLVFMTSMASFSAPFIFAGGFRVLSLEIYNAKLNGEMDMAVTQTVILSLFSIVFLLLMRWYAGRRAYTMSTKGVTVYRRPLHHPLSRWLMGGVGTLAVIILLLPHLTVVLLSFVKDGTWTWQVLPPTYTLENYTRLLHDTRVWEPILNSIQMATLATLGNLMIGVLAAYLLTKRTFPGRKAVDVLVMIPWALPGTVVALNLIVAFNRATLFSAGQILVGTFWILPLAYFIRHLPIVFRSSFAAFEQLDSSLEEAALNLGASWTYAFRRVVFPLVFPGIMVGVLLAFVTALGEFVSSILLYVYNNRPISVEILSQLRQFNFGSAAAYGVLLIILVSTVLLVSNRVLGSSASRAVY